MLSFFSSTDMLDSLIASKYPPTLSKFAKFSGNHIAFIRNGDPIFSPFIVIIFPPHSIADVGTILCSFTDIASAPAFFSSFINFLNIFN